MSMSAEESIEIKVQAGWALDHAYDWHLFLRDAGLDPDQTRELLPDFTILLTPSMFAEHFDISEVFNE